MKTNTPVLVFGEALFDCFPGGEQVLGGAPFNVAWHLQALGNHPHFISSIGNDELGKKILTAMRDWGMVTQSIQIDPVHQTGQVEVTIIKNEPHYTITPMCAYDFISDEVVENLPDNGILYHGTLGLRNSISRNCLSCIAQQPDLSIFLDVNLRNPWWKKQEVFDWLEQARWAKLNEDELQQLGFVSTDICQSMQKLLTQFQLEQLIVTQGAKGATVLAEDGSLFQETPAPVDSIIDTVGAGDGFSALFIHGLRAGWPIVKTLSVAQRFAGKVIGLRGATATEPVFYQEFLS
ncbi:MAG: carbohydrate kinase [Methylomarinum sp.]|nr:carbohydrate kinase [Methylomarinum sp.]